MSDRIKIYSEIAPLKKVLVHSPDGGIGHVPAGKLHEWLYDDIIDVKASQREYAAFQALLLLFLNPDKLFIDNGFVLKKNGNKRKVDGKKLFVNNPEKEGYYLTGSNFESANVVDTQFVLQQMMAQNKEAARDLIVSICAIEELHPYRKTDLLAMLKAGESDSQFYIEVVKTLLTGKLEYELNTQNELRKLPENEYRYIFPPIPNFIFTRDIGVTIGNHLLITKPKFEIRKREVLLFRFIAENYLCDDVEKIISVTEDDEFFQIEEKNQEEYRVSYEGGDIMMISDRHVLIGCSERTSPYAVQKLVHRLFWENIKTGHEHGIDTVSVIRIGEKRAQMHIDTVFTHIREDLWVVHSPYSKEWVDAQKEKDRHTREYNDVLMQKSAAQKEREKDLVIFQFHLNEEGKKIKKQFWNSTDENERQQLKSQFKKLDFLLRTDADKKYTNAGNFHFQEQPENLSELLKIISVEEFGVASASDVKFVLSGAGNEPFDAREQWTDACNLLTLRPGVSVGYDRNYNTIIHFNEVVSGEPVTEDPDFVKYMIEQNKDRFRERNDSNGKEMDIDHVLHVFDLFKYIVDNKLSLEDTRALIGKIKNTLILIPSKELSRARGGSHCMSLPIIRE